MYQNLTCQDEFIFIIITTTIINFIFSGLERLSDQDVNYLKITVGKPLTLALAEICVKQPRDPIHYLGHWLFKYRYNQEIDDIKKKEVEELIAERERIRLETWVTIQNRSLRNVNLSLFYSIQKLKKQHALPSWK